MIAPQSEAGPHTPEDIAALVADHPLLAGLPGDMARLVTGCARNVAVKPGEFLLVEGEAADTLFLLRRGRVSLEARAPGDVGGSRLWSLERASGGRGYFPPHRWQFDVDVPPNRSGQSPWTPSVFAERPRPTRSSATS